MLTRQLFAGLFLGSLGTVAVVFAFDPRNDARPGIWHEVATVPKDPHEFDNWWRDTGTAAWRQAIQFPREELFFVGSIKKGSVRTQDAGQSGR